VLTRKNARAEITQDLSRKRISIRTSGVINKDSLNQIPDTERELAEKREIIDKNQLMSLIMYELDKINDSYERLDVVKRVPCCCPSCRHAVNPYFYPYRVLTKFLHDGHDKIMCYESGNEVAMRAAMKLV
jgi:hypothetical protein